MSHSLSVIAKPLVKTVFAWYQLCTECVCVYSGNYPAPPAKYSPDLRSLIAELFRRNPRYSFSFSYTNTFMPSTWLHEYIFTLHCNFFVFCNISQEWGMKSIKLTMWWFVWL